MEADFDNYVVGSEKLGPCPSCNGTGIGSIEVRPGKKPLTNPCDLCEGCGETVIVKLKEKKDKEK